MCLANQEKNITEIPQEEISKLKKLYQPEISKPKKSRSNHHQTPNIKCEGSFYLKSFMHKAHLTMCLCFSIIDGPAGFEPVYDYPIHKYIVLFHPDETMFSKIYLRA